MKKFVVVALALFLAGGVAYANFCARDYVPAATLLVPYATVEVDASGVPVAGGQTTILTVTNVSREAQILHVTIWDATSIPQIDWNVVLTGYDVWSINFRDLLNGRFDIFDTRNVPFTASLPRTFNPFEWGPDGRGHGGVGPGVGSKLPAPLNFSASAIVNPTRLPAGVPPYGNRSDLAPIIRSKLKGPLVARTHGASCGALRGDLSRAPIVGNDIYFYVTIDVVQRWSLRFPNEAAYWGQDLITLNNVLIGDVLYFDQGRNYSEMLPAVHLEANYLAPEELFGLQFYEEKLPAGTITFREPLATAFGFRYANLPDAGFASNVILWKNYTELLGNGQVNDCGSYLYYAWDEDERSLSRTTEPISGLPTEGLDPNQFPYETQKVPLTGAYFDLPAAFGWMMLVLPPAYPFTDLGYGTIYVDPTTTLTPTQRLYMGWAAVQYTFGTYSAAVEAATLAHTHCFPWETLPAMNSNAGWGNEGDWFMGVAD